MRKQHLIYSLYPILILILITGFGCSTTKSVLKKIKPDETYIKKKIMVFPPIDLSGFPEEKVVRTTEAFIEILKQSPQLSIHTPPESWSLPTELKTPEFGVTSYNPDIIKMAKNKNMNALLAAFLPPIEKSKGRGGIWPFRYDTEVLKISIVLNVLDVTNECLYLTDFISEEIELPAKKTASLTENDILDRVLQKGVPDILEAQAAEVTRKLLRKPWTGRILDEKKGFLIINGGNDVGIQPDQLFTVFAQGESIYCKADRTLDLLGSKIGQIKAISVMEEHTLAAPESGGPFSAGQTIEFNPN